MKSRVEHKEKLIAKLENEINERVYRLYGLDASDVRVIEEFLERFQAHARRSAKLLNVKAVMVKYGNCGHIERGVRGAQEESGD